MTTHLLEGNQRVVAKAKNTPAFFNTNSAKHPELPSGMPNHSEEYESKLNHDSVSTRSSSANTQASTLIKGTNPSTPPAEEGDENEVPDELPTSSNGCGLSTEKLAKDLDLRPQSIRKRFAQTGSYFGVVPSKLPNGRLRWPPDAIARLLEKEAKQ